MQQIWIFWAIYMLIIFWKFYFPSHYRTYIINGRMKYIQLITLLIAYLHPILSVLSPLLAFVIDVQQPFYRAQNVSFTSGGMGYQTVQFPPLFCSPINYAVAYIMQIMPMNIIFPVSGTLLIFILRHMWKVGLLTLLYQRYYFD